MRRYNSLLQRSKKERTVCYKHHRVPHLKGECQIEKYASSFHEITYCSGQLRILGSNFYWPIAVIDKMIKIEIRNLYKIFGPSQQQAENKKEKPY